MPNDSSPEKPVTPKKELYCNISEHSINAMKLRKIGDPHSDYSDEIELIAKSCACLLKEHGEKLQTVIAHIEMSLHESYKEELKKLDGEIVNLFNRRKKAEPSTPYGEKEIVDLTVQINNLERRKSVSIADYIEAIVCDTLNQTIKNHGAELVQHYNPEEYEYHGEISFIRSSDL
ncbi:hypothetical protein [Legionella bononiensis]|uniref:Uncharacterized protein n=1 Tax=Legionella bononiensis TaxID=2793102 RepID=A0ABS1WEH6_9GAMM|nr:hypothetical protein [Legionella bononiensis]MBL7479329.1 hypothetical protein [Legionella bononiensis]MBL7479351.1 hypothetical protein [Legionella bononiensis]MBL7527767.1 hypothetical protein [Legionella bononiensis]MBL7563552.1 hypothetical protein [Legionella bononiensis]